MIRHKLVHAEVWGNFRKGYAASLPCYVHAYDCDANAYDFPFADAERIATRPTAWSAVGLVVVEYHLYKAAFDDPNTAACCLLSESCVPLVTAPVLIERALHVGRHLIRAGAKRFGSRLKGHQFKILSREGFNRLEAWCGDVSFEDKVLAVVCSNVYEVYRGPARGPARGAARRRVLADTNPPPVGLQTRVETRGDGVAPDEDIIPTVLLGSGGGGDGALLPSVLWVHPNQPFLAGKGARVSSRADAGRRDIGWTREVAAACREHPHMVCDIEPVASLSASALADARCPSSSTTGKWRRATRVFNAGCANGKTRFLLSRFKAYRNQGVRPG
jgi:hypothetical protein